jgi:hypothetical protein
MFEHSNGELFVYGSSLCKNNLKAVTTAAERMARLLNMAFEVKTFRKNFGQIYVYYRTGDDEPIPVYCSKTEKSDVEDVYSSLRNMMFVLSFHPRHEALKRVRQEIMRFS